MSPHDPESRNAEEPFKGKQKDAGETGAQSQGAGESLGAGGQKSADSADGSAVIEVQVSRDLRVGCTQLRLASREEASRLPEKTRCLTLIFERQLSGSGTDHWRTKTYSCMPFRNMKEL